MRLDLHGLAIECVTASPALAAALVRPFKFFVRDDAKATVIIEVIEEAPPYASLPPIAAQFSTPRNVVYRDRTRKVVDYFGRGAILQDVGAQRYRLYSTDRNLLCEAFYLLVTSLFGQHCDHEGLLRVHALAVSRGGRAVLMLIPQGGGKSTLGLRLLELPGVKLISDDDPVVARDGRILPYPKSLGFLDAERIAQIPAQFVSVTDRMEFGRKYLIDVDYWEGRIERAPLARCVLVVTERVLNGTPGIAPAPRRAALASLMRDSVFGVGLYQGIEFMFNHSSWEALGKGAVVGRRFARAARLAARADVYRLTLASDVEANVRVVEDFLARLD
jgi:hypothetical protein